MGALTRWLALGILASGTLLVSCEKGPEAVAPPPEPAAAAEAEPLTQPPVEEAAPAEPKEKKAEPERAAEVREPEAPAGPVNNVWAPGKEGKLLLGLDGGLYEPYEVRLIEEMQQALRAQGLYAGETHGYLDEETMKALAEFQERNGLRVSGVPTPRTRQALLAPARPNAT